MTVVGREDVSVLMPKDPGQTSGSGVDEFSRQDAYPAEARVLCHVVGMSLGPEPRTRSPVDSTTDEDSLNLRPWRKGYAFFDRRPLLIFSQQPCEH